MEIVIRKALPYQAPDLSEIARRAKGYWGYSAAQLEGWKEFLTLSPEYIAANRVWVACVSPGGDAEQVAGFAAVEQENGEAVLEHLWVLPEHIGRGIGRRLFAHVAAAVPEFVFTSDPHADAFYYKMGACAIGHHYSGLQQVMLTKFRYRAIISSYDDTNHTCSENFEHE